MIRAMLAAGHRTSAAILAAAIIVSAAAVSGAHAQSLQHDSSLPIEITADTLEVLRNEQIATFTGNVDAVQGDMVLSADLLRVFYGDDAVADAQGPAGTNSIRRIEAEGNVFLSSPRETAQGDAGVYDVASNQLTMDGAVVLTRDDNVIRGQRLEVDLVSGRSRVFAAVPSVEGGTAPQRVRALFTPEAAEPAAAPPDQSAAAGEDGAQ
ncbi:MAG TPA: LptA/OstA family protein [Geminicoccaceae bacterium]|jgi:lipopolysaccharide export system protein LptA|nr:LptA/OstA family protein [Geminicoccaceae bacterium]